jgi:hypothetical protein
MGDRIRYDIPRGPFRSSHDWMNAELNIIILQQTAILEKAEDEDDRDDAADCQSVAQRLLNLLPKVFPATQEDFEGTALYHDDLHLNNILVDEKGRISAILDWECVSALPHWLATKMPKFLDGQTREEEPQREIYADEPAEAAAQQHNNPDYLDNEGKDELYWIHRMEFQMTQLRRVYMARIKELQPEWPLEGSLVKMDFLQAIWQCDGIWAKQTSRWVDRMEKGEVVRLDDT